MALYGLYHKEKSERVYKLNNYVPDEPIDKIEATNPVVARVNFVRKLKLKFKEFQKLYSVRKLASLDSLDIKQQENLLLAAAVEESTVVAPYEKRSEIRSEQALKRNTGTASQIIKTNLPESYRPAGADQNQCKGCVQYAAGHCTLFNASVNPVSVCNSFVKNNIKRIIPGSTTLEVTPTSPEQDERTQQLEETRAKNRNPLKDKFRTNEEANKRVTEKKNPFSKGRKYGPKKRIELEQAPSLTDTQLIKEKDNSQQIDTDNPSAVSLGSSNTSSGGGSSY